LRLVYIDDVVTAFIEKLSGLPSPAVVSPVYEATLGEIADLLDAFRASRKNLLVEHVGSGLTRALYATYVSFLPKEDFAYALIKQSDARGDFVEMLKTKDSGQFSYFTAHPGVTRGGHFHHSKTEKFLIIRGVARFRFRNVVTDESLELNVSGETPQVVESIPGWAHDISNIGDQELVVMLWANERFDRSRPDTYSRRP
jgi:UDP-2-acetamido-2,6-beta-L-arabino-hexul-4-ose reductase